METIELNWFAGQIQLSYDERKHLSNLGRQTKRKRRDLAIQVR